MTVKNAKEMTALEVTEICEKLGLAVICENGRVSDVIIDKEA